MEKKIKKKEKQIGLTEIENSQIRVILRLQRNSICKVTGKYTAGNNSFYVHRIVPKEHGGSDDLENLKEYL